MIRARAVIPTGARPGEYASQVVGDAVESLVDGSVTGADNYPAHRAEMLAAIAQGQSLFVPPGDYIWTDSVVRTGEAVNNSGIRGVPGRTRIYRKTGNAEKNLTLLNFDGTLEVDGVSGTSPTYYLTAPALQGAESIQLSTLTGLTKGMWLMLIDRTHHLNHYSASPSGSIASLMGQKVQIQDIEAQGPNLYAILSSVYVPNVDDPDAGIMIITSAGAPILYGLGAEISLSSLTGTGDVDLLNNLSYITVSETRGFTTTIVVGDLDPTTAINTGTISYGVAVPNSINILPKLECDFAGTSTTPHLNSTLIRRFSRSPENINVEGIIFDWDKQAPPLNTQVCVAFSALVSPRSSHCQFFGEGTGYNVVQGTHDYSISEFFFDEGGPLQYGINNSTGSCWGRIYNGSGFRGRHVVNTLTSTSIVATTCAPKHIHVLNVHAYGYFETPFADHPGCVDLTYTKCSAIGGKADGFMLRANDERLVACVSSGNSTGANLVFGINAVVDGGLFVGNGIGIAVVRSVNPKIINFPVVRNSKEMNIFMDMSIGTNPYNVAYPGMFIEADVGGAADVADGVPYLADLVLGQKNANFDPVWDDSWRFNLRASGRAPTYMVSRPSPITTTISVGSYDTVTDLATITSAPPIVYRPGDTVTLSALTGTGDFASLNGLFPTRAGTTGNTTVIYAPGLAALTLTGGTISFGTRSPSFHPFRLEYAGLPSRKYRAFNVVPGLDADYELDTEADNVPATLPASGYLGQKVTFSKPNVGGSTASVVGQIGVDTNPTLADGAVYRAEDSGKVFTVLSGSYSSGGGVTTLNMRRAMPWALADGTLPAGITITVSGLTGTGADLASLNGVQVTLTGANTKTVRFTDSAGLTVTSITGGSVTVGGWTKR